MKKGAIIFYFISIVLLVVLISNKANYGTKVTQVKSATLDSKTVEVVLITGNSVNIRTTPSKKGEIVTKVDAGAEYKLLSTEDDWYKIELPTNKIGYVSNSVAITKQLAGQVAKITGPLGGRVIVLDPGHGGNDGGTIGKNGTLEKDLTLKVAKRLRQQLEELGATVHMTREQDEYVSLRERATFSQTYQSDIFISLHYDSNELSEVKGITTFYYNKDRDFNLGEIIHGNLIEEVAMKDRDVVRGNLQVLRDNERPAILIELGFLSNGAEEQQLIQESYQKQMVTGIKNGIVEYFNELNNEKGYITQ